VDFLTTDSLELKVVSAVFAVFFSVFLCFFEGLGIVPPSFCK